MCLALLSSKLAVMKVQKEKVQTVEGEERKKEHKTDGITEQQQMAVKPAKQRVCKIMPLAICEICFR